MLGKQKLEGEALEQFSGLTRLFKGEKVDFHYPLATANWQGRDGEQHSKDYGLGVVFHRAGALKGVASIMGNGVTFPPLCKPAVEQGAVVMTSKGRCRLSPFERRNYRASDFSSDFSLGFHTDAGKGGVGLNPVERHFNAVTGLWQQGGLKNGRTASTLISPTAYVAHIIEEVRDLTFQQAVDAKLVSHNQQKLWKTFQESVPNDDQYGGIGTVMAVRDFSLQHLFGMDQDYRREPEYKHLPISPEIGALINRVNYYVFQIAQSGTLAIDWDSPSFKKGTAVVIGNGYLENPDATKWEFVHSRNNYGKSLTGGPVYLSPPVRFRMPKEKEKLAA